MEIDTEQLKLEKDALDQSLALNKVVVSLLEERKKEMRHIWMVLLTICIIFAIAISVFAYFNYTDKQMLMEYLDTIEYTTTETTTETTITQDTGEGSGNNVYQAGSDVVYNEAGGE